MTSTASSATGPPTWPASMSTRRRPRPRCAGSRQVWRRQRVSTPQQPLTSDAHHLVRAAARDRLTPGQRQEARLAALDAAAAFGIVAVHECAGPDIGGIDDWIEVRDTDHGVEIIGYWGEHVTTADQARDLIDRTGARGLAGDLFVDGALGSRTAWLHQPYTDALARMRQHLPRRRRDHRPSTRLHRGRHHRGLPRHR